MSCDRTACSLHQKNFFHNLSLSATKSDSTNSFDSSQISSHKDINNKIEHANRTFAKWTGSLNKKIFSNRLGISYDTSIRAVSHRKLLFSPDNIPSPMYVKAFDNYQENFSIYDRTKLRQVSRLNRLKNRVFRIAAALQWNIVVSCERSIDARRDSCWVAEPNVARREISSDSS